LNVMELTNHESSLIHGNSQIEISHFHVPFWMKISSKFSYFKHLWSPLHERPCWLELNQHDLHPSLIWSSNGGDEPHTHVGMPIEWITWKRRFLPMWAFMPVLFIVHHFTSDPIHIWHKYLFKQLSFSCCAKA
jgi:hypothetical protein